MNIELLRKIQQAIKQHPKHFDMSGWFISNQCETTACIAGWAITLTEQKEFNKVGVATTPEEIIKAQWSYNSTSFMNVSRTEFLLDIDTNMAHRLFYTEHWPKEFRNAYTHAKFSKEKAKVAVARIEHFIATHGEE